MSSNKIVNLANPMNAQDAATKTYVDTSIPVGGIIMWSGAGVTLPSNWKLCDGSTYGSVVTPDLRGRFVLSSTTSTSANGNIALASGLSTRDVNTTGGVETVALALGEMPSHSHGVKARIGAADGTATDGDHNHTTGGLTGFYRSASNPSPFASGYQQLWTAGNHIDGYRYGGGSDYTVSSSSSNHKHTITVSEDAKGSGTAHENMPPFYVLAFIMRVS